MKNLIKRIDRLATTLEKKGLTKEAHDLDIIANTLESQKGILTVL